ncbi:hypothetical protein D3C74_422150 [compost metagenome]
MRAVSVAEALWVPVVLSAPEVPVGSALAVVPGVPVGSGGAVSAAASDAPVGWWEPASGDSLSEVARGIARLSSDNWSVPDGAAPVPSVSVSVTGRPGAWRRAFVSDSWTAR